MNNHLSFLTDFRDREINYPSFWYGFLQAVAMTWITRWALEGTGMEWWRLPLVAVILVAAKWFQCQHTLKP